MYCHIRVFVCIQDESLALLRSSQAHISDLEAENLRLLNHVEQLKKLLESVEEGEIFARNPFVVRSSVRFEISKIYLRMMIFYTFFKSILFIALYFQSVYMTSNLYLAILVEDSVG